MLKQIIGRLLQGLSFFLDKLSYVTHPDRLADRIDPFICRFTGEHTPDPEKLYCDRCFQDLKRKPYCIKCGDDLE